MAQADKYKGATYGSNKFHAMMEDSNVERLGGRKWSFKDGSVLQMRPGKGAIVVKQNPIGSKPVLCRVKRVGNKLHITKVGR